MLLKINEIIEIYQKMNYKLTLRQLYYQLVSQNIIPNKLSEYTKIGDLLVKGRMCGIVDWDAIEDRVRVPRLPYYAHDINDAIKDTVNQFRLNRMRTQNVYIELWVEKDALSAVLSRRTYYYHINLMVNRGYSSATAMFDAYQRLVYQISQGKKATILYLGDHDPSGLDMIRDIKKRLLEMLCNQPDAIAGLYDEINMGKSEVEYDYRKAEAEYGVLFGQNADYYELYVDGEIDELKLFVYTMFDLKHIGLTSEQIRLYEPPENPAKLKDPRAKWYVEKFGLSSWEVDALKPEVLHEIIDTAVKGIINIDEFQSVLIEEQEQRTVISKLPALRDNVSDMMDELGTLIDTIPKPPKGKRSHVPADLKTTFEELHTKYSDKLIL